MIRLIAISVGLIITTQDLGCSGHSLIAAHALTHKHSLHRGEKPGTLKDTAILDHINSYCS